jgi:hypothetical protein
MSFHFQSTAKLPIAHGDLRVSIAPSAMRPSISLLAAIASKRTALCLLAVSVVLIAGCTTRTKATVGKPRSELAILQIPDSLQKPYNSFFFNLFSVTIDGEIFDTSGKFYVVPGPHDISVHCGLLAPRGSASYVAERGTLHFLVMETKGYGSMQAYQLKVVAKKQ